MKATHRSSKPAIIGPDASELGPRSRAVHGEVVDQGTGPVMVSAAHEAVDQGGDRRWFRARPRPPEEAV